MDAMTSTSTAPDDFDQWLEARPMWLQTAAANLFGSSKPPSPQELEALADLCQGEAINANNLVFRSIPAGAFGQPLTPLKIRIEKIHSIRGLNAIRNDASLNFGENNLTIIYGANGVGKTGFSRLIKNICGARHSPVLLPNIFSKTNESPSAKIDITYNENRQTLTWLLETGPLQALKHVHVFDNMTASSYVNEKNEASYETRRLRFISALVRICDQVSEILATRRKLLNRPVPTLPDALANTAAAKFMRGITYKTNPKQIEAACSFSHADKDERISLEASLKEGNFVEKLAEIRRQKQQLSQISSLLNNLINGLSSEKFEELFAAHQDAHQKRQAATKDAQRAFSNATLSGIGESSWRLLWEQARAYSETFAYPNHPFPVVEDDPHCVLCQQPLDQKAKERLINFEVFVRGALETQAQAAEKILKDAIAAFPELPEQEDWRLKLSYLGFDEDFSNSHYLELTRVRKQVDTISQKAPDQTLHWGEIQERYNSTSKAIHQAEQSLLDAQDLKKRATMQERLKELQGKEWLSQQRRFIDEEVLRQAKIFDIKSAEKLTNTTSLTSKKNELMIADLAQGYKERFSRELILLGGERIPVEPQAITQGKGRISFQLSIKGATNSPATHAILSDGENRIAALSAFLADMTGLGFPSPFVFDDPISSLDQDFEERVVARLIELAKDRQVIVFTHRLSLVTLLEDAQDSAGLSPARIETLRRIGSHIGVTDKLNVREKKPKNGFNALRSFLHDLRKLEEAGKYPAYEAGMKTACSDFRILIEKSVESILLNAVILRFRRGIQTDGRLGSLAKITTDDCALIDEMMTKYSRYEHSQSDELPATLPAREDVDNDISIMLDWIERFTKRQPN